MFRTVQSLLFEKWKSGKHAPWCADNAGLHLKQTLPLLISLSSFSWSSLPKVLLISYISCCRLRLNENLQTHYAPWNKSVPQTSFMLCNLLQFNAIPVYVGEHSETCSLHILNTVTINKLNRLYNKQAYICKGVFLRLKMFYFCFMFALQNPFISLPNLIFIFHVNGLVYYYFFYHISTCDWSCLNILLNKKPCLLWSQWINHSKCSICVIWITTSESHWGAA